MDFLSSLTAIREIILVSSVESNLGAEFHDYDVISIEADRYLIVIRYLFAFRDAKFPFLRAVYSSLAEEPAGGGGCTEFHFQTTFNCKTWKMASRKNLIIKIVST